MSREDMITWTQRARRLLDARTRFNESLSAIQDLVNFATEHVSELDATENVKFSIKPSDIDGLSGENARAFADATVELLQSLGTIAQSVPSEDEARFKDNIERGGMPDEAREAFLKYESALPKEIDPGVIVRLLNFQKLSRARTDLLFASLLTAAVGDFEVLFSEIVTFFYHLRPDALKAHDAQLTWSEIDSYKSLEDLRVHFIDERVSQLMWKGFDDWMKWLDQQLKIKYSDIALDVLVASEVFQRRHIIVHNGGLVSPQYMTKMSGRADLPALGTRLRVDQQYLDSAINQLTVLGFSIVDRVMRRLAVNAEQEKRIDTDILDLTFDLLKAGRWTCVDKIATNALPGIVGEYNRFAVRVNRWIALKRLKGIDSIRDEVAKWDISALENKFRLAQLVLLDDPSAIDMACVMTRDEEITQESIDTWPLFENIRDAINDILKPPDSMDEPA